MKRCLIGTPVYGGAHPDFVASLDDTVAALPKIGWAVKPMMRTGSLITLQRNGICADFFLNTDADVLLWIDADEGFPVSDVASVLEATTHFPIVGGVYREKPLSVGLLDWGAIAAAAKAGMSPKQLQFVGQKLTLDFLPDDVDGKRGYIGPTRISYGRRFVRVAHVGTGFLAVTRAAVATLYEATPQLLCNGGMHALFNSGIADGAFNGEDWLFCNLARAAGLEVWVDTETEIDHIGPTAWRGTLKGEWLNDYARQQSHRVERGSNER